MSAIDKLKEISDLELKDDLLETEHDIALCEVALYWGVLEVSGLSVRHRLEENLRIKRVIEAEIARRTGCQQAI